MASRALNWTGCCRKFIRSCERLHAAKNAHLGFGGRQIFVKARNRRNPTVQSVGRRILRDEFMPEGLDVVDRGLEHLPGVLPAVNLQKPDEGHEVLAVGALGVQALLVHDPGPRISAIKMHKLLMRRRTSGMKLPARILGSICSDGIAGRFVVTGAGFS